MASGPLIRFPRASLAWAEWSGPAEPVATGGAIPPRSDPEPHTGESRRRVECAISWRSGSASAPKPRSPWPCSSPGLVGRFAVRDSCFHTRHRAAGTRFAASASTSVARALVLDPSRGQGKPRPEFPESAVGAQGLSRLPLTSSPTKAASRAAVSGPHGVVRRQRSRPGAARGAWPGAAPTMVLRASARPPLPARPGQ
jgi:hypothetical protein